MTSKATNSKISDKSFRGRGDFDHSSSNMLCNCYYCRNSDYMHNSELNGERSNPIWGALTGVAIMVGIALLAIAH